jgi:hypothetical protein
MKLEMLLVGLLAPSAYAARESCEFSVANSRREWRTEGCYPPCSYDRVVSLVPEKREGGQCEVQRAPNACEVKLRSLDGSDCVYDVQCEVSCR